LIYTNLIYHIDVLYGFKYIDNESVDIVLIDPPYNIGKDFGNNFDNLELNDYIEWSQKWINESLRVLKPTGSIYIYGFSEILCYLFPKIQANKRWLVWHYTNKNIPSSKFWQRSHESIILAWKTEKKFFNLDDVREKYTDTFLKNAAGNKRKGTQGRFSKNGKETIYNAHPKGALPRDVIKIPALAGGAGRTERFFYCRNCNDLFEFSKRKLHKDHIIIEHPTQKPSDLTRKLLAAAMPKNKKGFVLVPFSGTGTELYIANQMGMEAIGFDINLDYVKMGNKLLENGLPQNMRSPPKKAGIAKDY
jgi:site-specific DNA-methyltransferase (adenine-specific)